MMVQMAEKKNPGQALVALRNKKLSPEERKEIASIAAKARWARKRKKPAAREAK